MVLVATAAVNLKVAITAIQTVEAMKAATMDLQAAAKGALASVDVLIQIGVARLAHNREGECLLMTMIPAIGISKAEEAAQVLVTGDSKAVEAACPVQVTGDNSKAEAAAAITKEAICLQDVVAQCLAAAVLNLTVVHNNLVVAVHNPVVMATAAAGVVPIKVLAATVI